MKSPLLLAMSKFILLCLPLCLFLDISVTPAASPLGRSFCHDQERSALLQFKQAFIIGSSASTSPLGCTKFESWKLQGEGSNCCTWDGIECDNNTGHVVGLDLSGSCLYGSINSNSSLFDLVHLRRLNLANNHFNGSQIPSRLGEFSKLVYLNLSYSVFSGLIPPQISQLSKLISLDLSSNAPSMGPQLSMTDFRPLVQNLTSLEVFHLPNVYIATTVPNFLANLSSLESLILRDSSLYGEFPPTVFQLPNLQVIDLSENGNLGGHLPEFNSSSPLVKIDLALTSFKGELPTSIGNLHSLQVFDTLQSGFFGRIPDSFGNLTQLVHLGLYGNPFEVPNVSSLAWLGKQTKLVLLGFFGFNLNSEIPSYIANLTQLRTLALSNCQVTGHIPSWLSKLTQVSWLQVDSNQLQGPIPSSIFDLTQLTVLDFSNNNLQGPIPASMSQLKSLERLSLDNNNLSGVVELGTFFKIQNLTKLHLSGNKLSVGSKENINASSIHKFINLGLGSCNLQLFPDFLHNQDQLVLLDLSQNNIQGLIPRWICNISKETLQFMDLSGNFLTGIEHCPTWTAWVQLTSLNLGSNLLQGPLPVPPTTIRAYDVSRNNFTGKIPSLFCSLNSLTDLDLSHNNLRGMIPQCLSNLSSSLELLDLGGNNFHGMIPLEHPVDCNLQVLALGGNQLSGQVPRSLANCDQLEFLDVANNKINDAFPGWLGGLQELKVLILRSNQFHGALDTHQTNSDQFPKLHIIDLSQNSFSGQIPTEYFLGWKAMKVVDYRHLKYMQTVFSIVGSGVNRDALLYTSFKNSILITNKGITREYSEIFESFVAIDLSSNKFEGEIPESIVGLSGIHLLNLSRNIFSGSIPSSLGNLTELESLDLSRNNLLGEIPQQLKHLNFLAVFDVSGNNLTGSIPQGNQFDTFQNSSYKGNPGLCGIPLSRKCGTSAPPSSTFEENPDNGDSTFGSVWKPVLVGYASGTFVGLVIGHFVVTRNYEWFLKTFRVRPHQRQRNYNRNRRPRN